MNNKRFSCCLRKRKWQLFFDDEYLSVLLAALIYNANCDRPLLEDEYGKQQLLRVEYLKYQSGVGEAKGVRPPKTKGSNLQCTGLAPAGAEGRNAPSKI
mgnify:CR=1 FL=1